MATFNLTTNLTNGTNREQVRLYKASSPNAMIDSVIYAAPHVGGHTWTFNNLIPSANYLYRWVEIDGSGNIIQQYGSQNFTVPASGSISSRTPQELLSDTSPNVSSGLNTITLDGTNGSIDIRGWDIILENKGFGTQFQTLAPDYTYNKTTGVITFADVNGAPYQIAPDEKYFIQFINKVLGAAPVVVQGSFNNIKYISVDYTILDVDFGTNLLQVDSSLAYLYLTLPDIATVPENKELIIKTGNSGHKNVTIQSSNANAIDWLEGNRTNIYICIRESLKIYRQNKNGVNTWQVIDAEGNFKFVGLIVSDYSPIGNALNRIPAEGGLFGITEYARLVWDYILKLPPGQVVSFADWPLNKTRFSFANTFGLFHVPDLRDLFERNTDGTRSPGTFQDQQLLSHKHEETVGQLPTSLFGSGSPRPQRTLGKYLSLHSNYGDWTSLPMQPDGTDLGAQLGSENRPKNYTVRKFILC